MTRLAISAGPPVALPLAFLGAVPVWGMAAGLVIAGHGAQALTNRWAPPTLMLVHAATLGVLGNAIAGSLLQFLPAAAGTRVRGGWRAGVAVFIALQTGTLALLGGFRTMDARLLTLGASCALAAFALLAACTLPGLLAGREAVHRGIAAALGALVAAVVLGAAMAFAMAGHLPAPAPLPWADVHAMWGLLGGVLVLLGAVGQVVLPMFQGIAAQPEARQAAWRAGVAATLALATASIVAGHARIAAAAVAACTAAWALPLLVRQARAPHRRGGPLRVAWAVGALAMLACAGALAAGAPPTLVGALALALALPMPVLAMLLEIVAFLGWIDLQRRTPRGVRVPPVQALLPARMRGAALAALAAAGGGVVLATLHPALAGAAGVGLTAAYGTLLLALVSAALRRRRFLAGVRRA